MPKTYRTAYLSAETTPSNTPLDILTSNSIACKVIVVAVWTAGGIRTVTRQLPSYQEGIVKVTSQVIEDCALSLVYL
jgi:hypothetical protein